MLATLALFAMQTRWYPIFVEKIDTARADIFAPSQAAALTTPAQVTPTDHVWIVTSLKPDHRSPNFTIPTQAQWQQGVDVCPDSQHPEIQFGDPCVLTSQLQGRDNPNYLPTWNLYRTYQISIVTFAYYYNATSLQKALDAAKAEWLTGGVYALGRPLTQTEMTRWTTGDPLLELNIPSRKWQALMNCLCEPNEVFTYASPTPYASRPPYPCRTEP